MNSRIDVQYQTLSLPPPYAYEYSLRAELKEESVEVALDWQYTDRDELSEEEIWEEGFTSDDDFQWKGALPAVWKAALNNLLHQTRLLPEYTSTSQQGALLVTLIDNKGQTTSGSPDNLQQWDYQLQELIQGTYEAAQRERPLHIRYLDNDRIDHAVEVTFTINFLHRRFTIARQEGAETHTQKLPWDRVHSLLEALYLPDYNFDQSSAAYPRKPGRYVDPGDERWYQLGRAASNPGNADALSPLYEIMNEIITLSQSR